jgi:hypothetical protein
MDPYLRSRYHLDKDLEDQEVVRFARWWTLNSEECDVNICYAVRGDGGCKTSSRNARLGAHAGVLLFLEAALPLQLCCDASMSVMTSSNTRMW